jgi:hypothetical protein
MVYTCSHCGVAGHNKRTCPKANEPLVCKPVGRISTAEKHVAKKLAALLPPVKAKKSPKVLDGLEGCKNIWKIPASFYQVKKSPKVLDGLEGCKNIWKEPASFYQVKYTTKCSVCGEIGHNSRFHKSHATEAEAAIAAAALREILAQPRCSPCHPKKTPIISVSNEDQFGVLEEIKKVSFTGAPGTGFGGVAKR